MNEWAPIPISTNEIQSSRDGSVFGTVPIFGRREERPRPRTLEKDADNDFVLPPHRMYAGMWNRGIGTYLWRTDEALRKSIEDSRLVLKDATIKNCLRRRYYPVANLKFAVEPDNHRDPGQAAVAARLTKLVDATWRFHNLKLSLLNAIFYGKAGAQLKWGKKTIDGAQSIVVIQHVPVDGDKILHKFDGTPGILINAQDLDKYRPMERKCIETATGSFGPAMFLRTKALRKRFAIHTFEPTDQGYWQDGDMAGAIHGQGLRHSLWYIWNLRNEVLTWAMDAIQRVGANGGVVGFYPHGNSEFVEDMSQALRDIVRDHVAMIPYREGSEIQHLIQPLPVNATGYEVLANFRDFFEMLIREMILGEQGQGSPVNTVLAAELMESGRLSVQRADAQNLSETLTDDLLLPMIEFNHAELAALAMKPRIDFGLKLKLQFENPDSMEELQKVQLLIGIGQALGQPVPIDVASLISKGGFEATDDPNAMAAPPMDAQNPQGPGGYESNPRVRTERPTTNEGGDPDRYKSDLQRMVLGQAAEILRERYGWNVAPASKVVPAANPNPAPKPTMPSIADKSPAPVAEPPPKPKGYGKTPPMVMVLPEGVKLHPPGGKAASQPPPKPAPASPPPPAKPPAAVAAPSPAPDPQPGKKPFSHEDFARDFEAAFHKIDRKNRSTNFVRAVDMRNAMPHLTPEEFNAGLRQLRLDDHFTMNSHEGRHGPLTPEEKAAGISEAGSLLTYISRRSDRPSDRPVASKPAPVGDVRGDEGQKPAVETVSTPNDPAEWTPPAVFPTREKPLEVSISPQRKDGKPTKKADGYHAFALDEDGSVIRFEKSSGEAHDVEPEVGDAMPSCTCGNFKANKYGQDGERKTGTIDPLYTCKHIKSAIANGLIPPVTDKKRKSALDYWSKHPHFEKFLAERKES